MKHSVVLWWYFIHLNDVTWLSKVYTPIMVLSVTTEAPFFHYKSVNWFKFTRHFLFPNADGLHISCTCTFRRCYAGGKNTQIYIVYLLLAFPSPQCLSVGQAKGRADGTSVAEGLSRQKQRNITWLKGQSPGEEDLKLLFDVRHIFDGLEVWH